MLSYGNLYLKMGDRGHPGVVTQKYFMFLLGRKKDIVYFMEAKEAALWQRFWPIAVGAGTMKGYNILLGKSLQLMKVLPSKVSDV